MVPVEVARGAGNAVEQVHVLAASSALEFLGFLAQLFYERVRRVNEVH
jgi:hypothetical protein